MSALRFIAIMLSIVAAAAILGFAATGGLIRALGSIVARMKLRLNLPLWGVILLPILALVAREVYPIARQWRVEAIPRAEGTPLRSNGSLDATLPTYQQLVGLHGKSIETSEFLEVKRCCRLILLEHKKDLSYWMNGRRVLETMRFGGSGVIVVASALGDVVADLTESKTTQVLLISEVHLVIDQEGEGPKSGIWKGQLPPFDLLRTPQALLKRYPYPDSDVVEVSRVTGAPEGCNLSWTRTINYHVPALGLKPPCTFVFRADGLLSVKVWPEAPPWRTVRPQPPEIAVSPLTEKPNKAPEPTERPVL